MCEGVIGGENRRVYEGDRWYWEILEEIKQVDPVRDRKVKNLCGIIVSAIQRIIIHIAGWKAKKHQSVDQG